MKNILLIAALTLGLCMQAQKKLNSQEVHYIKKEPPLVIKSVTPISICDSTLVTYTVKEGKVGSTVGGAVIGKLLFGGAGLIAGAIAGSNTQDEYTTHTRWDKHYKPGYRIIVSDGYTFNTTDVGYKVGQPIKYK